MKKNDVGKTIDHALEQLAAALANGQSEAFTRYLAAMARFHAYSVGNILLILAQRPEATRIAGYRTWRNLGRHVKRGEKGILITAPIVLTKRSKDRHSRAPMTDREDYSLICFKAVYVFDVSQTDGKPLPEPLRVGGTPGSHTESLKAFVAAKGIALEYSNTLGAADGLSCGGRIKLREGLAPAEEFSVLAHELAHSVLHRGDKASSKTVRETEAEAVAYVVSQAIGLDGTRAASDYIRLYDGDKDVLAASLERIRRTAATIIEGLGLDGKLRRAA